MDQLKVELIKLKAPALIVFSGVMGCGKSHTINQLLDDSNLVNHFKNLQVLSLDSIRLELSGESVVDGKFFINGWIGDSNKRAVETFHQRLEQNLKNNVSTIVDSTNLLEKYRAELKREADSYNFSFFVVLVHASLQDCLERNANRKYYVAPAVVEESFKKFRALSKFNHYILKN